MKLPNFCRWALLGVILMGAAQSARATEVLSNLNEPLFSSSPLLTGLWFGNRFVTDTSAASYSLDSVTLSLGSTDNSTDLFVALYTDAGNQPGISLGSLLGNLHPNTGGNYTYTTGSSISLSANTSYWVVAGVTTGSGSYIWNLTDSGNYTGTWSIPLTDTHTHSSDQGSSWINGDGFPRQFSVSATAVPEPGMTAVLAGLAALGLVAWMRRRG